MNQDQNHRPRERDKCARCKRYFPINMMEYSYPGNYGTCRCPTLPGAEPKACLRCTLPTRGGWAHGSAEICVMLLLEWIRDTLSGREKFLAEIHDKLRALVEKRKAS